MKLKYFQCERKNLSSQLSQAPLCRRRQIKSRIQAAKRMQGIWWPKNRKIKLSGLRVNASSESTSIIVSSPEEMQAALKDYWKPAYSPKPVDDEAIGGLSEQEFG